MPEQKPDLEPGPAAPAPAPAAPAAATAAAKPAPPASPAAAKPAPPPKVEAPSLPPAEMIPQDLKSFLRERLESGEEITVEIGKTLFTGRLFRTMIHEGWIALEHLDGRRKAFMVIEGGKIRDGAGREFTLPGGHGK